MRKAKYVILILLISLVFTGCSNNIKVNETEGEYFSKLYDVAKDNPYKRISSNDALDMIKNGTGILYLGYNTCPWCKQIVPILNDSAKDRNINSIYYIEDFYDMRPDKNSNPKNIDDYNELLELLKNIILEDDYNNKIIRVPLILFIKNGKIVSYHRGTYEGHTLKTKIDENGNEVKYLEDLTEDEKANVKSILIEKINKVYDKNCDNGC